jgi:hypothetical protein
MSKRIKLRPAARFRIGDKVRVRHGVMDINYPDMPIGGWAGTVSATHNGDTQRRHTRRPMDRGDSGLDPSRLLEPLRKRRVGF